MAYMAYMAKLSKTQHISYNKTFRTSYSGNIERWQWCKPRL